MKHNLGYDVLYARYDGRDAGWFFGEILGDAMAITLSLAEG